MFTSQKSNFAHWFWVSIGQGLYETGVSANNWSKLLILKASKDMPRHFYIPSYFLTEEQISHIWTSQFSPKFFFFPFKCTLFSTLHAWHKFRIIFDVEWETWYSCCCCCRWCLLLSLYKQKKHFWAKKDLLRNRRNKKLPKIRLNFVSAYIFSFDCELQLTSRVRYDFIRTRSMNSVNYINYNTY